MSLDTGIDLRIDLVEVPGVSGRIGMCACPGGRRILRPDFDPELDLVRDLEAVRASGACGLVSLVEEHEFAMLGVEALPEAAQRLGLWWRHLPIVDMRPPNRAFDRRWQDDGQALRDALGAGESLVLHCLAGLGRTGTIAARLLVEFGMEPAAAILRVRDSRPGAIQTRQQERYVLRLKP